MRQAVHLTFLAVAGVVIGLVAMHTLSVEAPHHAPTAAAVAAEHHPAQTEGMQSTRSTTDECGPSGCQPLHAMGLMVCVLALLVVSLIVGEARRGGRRMEALPTTGPSLAFKLRAIAPDPPSLITLSISRT